MLHELIFHQTKLGRRDDFTDSVLLLSDLFLRSKNS